MADEMTAEEKARWFEQHGRDWTKKGAGQPQLKKEEARYGEATLRCPCGYETRTEKAYWQIGQRLSKYCPFCDETTTFEVVDIWGFG